MKILYLIIITAIGCNLLACEGKEVSKKQYEVEEINSISEEEVPDPPPPNYRSRFSTLDEWLSHICDNEKPGKPISTFIFGLFEEGNNYTLFLTGNNTYMISRDHTESKIDFAPVDMYFSLTGNDYKDLNREQVLERIMDGIRAFTRTEKFKQSFFHEAKSITTSWNGERVWISK
ncbi:MAG TPA: hypothetical protein VM935_05665 [Chitinophagaceae bacterium]|jgi:AAA15 family ATPase/GTPase|nr:hypothetical protein [Chitinophagaceae bacterium]